MGSPDIYLLITAWGTQKGTLEPSFDKASKPPDPLLPKLKIAWSSREGIVLGVGIFGALVPYEMA